jgi:hypothetical protein
MTVTISEIQVHQMKWTTCVLRWFVWPQEWDRLLVFESLKEQPCCGDLLEGYTVQGKPEELQKQQELPAMILV